MCYAFKRQYFILLTLLAFIVNGNTPLLAQISIGTTETPVKGALLQLKTTEGITDGSANANKGLMLPRVSLSEKGELFPMFLKDRENPNSGRSSEYDQNKASLDKDHAGLTVYNMNEDYEKDLCLGVNIWDGKIWNCLIYPKYGYEMMCNSVEVHGVYWKGRALDASNKITLKIVANDAKAVGKTYYIKTEEVGGISFFGQGKITDDATSTQGQTITLQGKGTPTDRETRYVTLLANNLSSETCRAKIYIVIPKKNILVLGNAYLRGYNFSLTTTNTNKVFTSPSNFGSGENNIDPVFPYEMAPFLNGQNGLSTTYDAALSSSQHLALKKALLEDQIVDILVITHDVYMVNSDHVATINEYLNRGGVVVALWEANPSSSGSAPLFNAVFGVTGSVSHKINSGGAIYQLIDTDDPILSGPFGVVGGKYWGDDWFWSESISGLPEDQMIVYSRGKDFSGTTTSGYENSVTAFRHKTKNLVFFGDGGFIATGYGANDTAMSTDNLRAPFWWNETTMHPVEKPNYGRGSTKYSVQNSILFCNIMAWAIYQAEVNGINSPSE